MTLVKRKLSAWSKSVKKALIDRDLSLDELAKLIGYSSTYTRNVVNGKIIGAVAAENRINEVLDLK